MTFANILTQLSHGERSGDTAFIMPPDAPGSAANIDGLVNAMDTLANSVKEQTAALFKAWATGKGAQSSSGTNQGGKPPGDKRRPGRNPPLTGSNSSKLVRPWTEPCRVVAKVGDYVYGIEWMDGSYRKPELARLKAYSARELVTPALPALEDFEQPLHVKSEEVIPPLDRDANQHKERNRLRQLEEGELSEEQLALVGKYFKYGGACFVVKSVGYDEELKANAVRYRLVEGECEGQ